MSKLSTFVHVSDDEGVVHAFGPADNVPAWAVKKITNRLVWVEGEGGTPEPVEETPVEASIPPKGGPKATVEAWTSYATAHGVEIEGEATRKQIIEFLDAEGIPTE